MCAPPLNVYFLGYSRPGNLIQILASICSTYGSTKKQLYRHYNKYIERDTQKSVCIHIYLSLEIANFQGC